MVLSTVTWDLRHQFRWVMRDSRAPGAQHARGGEGEHEEELVRRAPVRQVRIERHEDSDHEDRGEDRDTRYRPAVLAAARGRPAAPRGHVDEEQEAREQRDAAAPE